MFTGIASPKTAQFAFVWRKASTAMDVFTKPYRRQLLAMIPGKSNEFELEIH
jgi:hypothetical protein